ncbi:7260_t:CDS:2 [Acaulospora morrowiae]|uniref:7260_t:CDS:1 n=1 Tax=Acaulospora morrowiae TaxID=94023 RepID=A0A9N9ABP7_9GLOM|nr:7260_t:CDS:2 [Acaulospora morrowiae]
MIAAFPFQSDQYYNQPSTTTNLMNIGNSNSGGTNLGDGLHQPLFRREIVSDQDIKDDGGGGLLVNDSSSEPSSPTIPLGGPIFPYPSIIPYRQVKRRRRLTEEETNVLISTFEDVQKPDADLRTRLAKQLKMSSRAVQVWFQNRRAKVKRDALESKNAAKMNRPKQLTLAPDYCQEKKITEFESMPSSSPVSSYASSPNDSNSKDDLSSQRMIRPINTQSIANISFALTSSNNKHSGENIQSSHYPQTVSNNNMNNENNRECDSAAGLLQQESYWNTSANFNTGNGNCLPSEQRLETSPLEVSSLSEQMLDSFYQGSSESYYWSNGQQEIFTSPAGLGVETPVGPNNTPIQNPASPSKFENLPSTISNDPPTHWFPSPNHHVILNNNQTAFEYHPFHNPILSAMPTNLSPSVWTTSFVTNVNQTENSEETGMQSLSIDLSCLQISAESNNLQNFSQENSLISPTTENPASESVTAKNNLTPQSPYPSGFDKENHAVDEEGETDGWDQW